MERSRSSQSVVGVIVINGEAQAASVLIPLLVLDLVGWAEDTAESFRRESEDKDWTVAERKRFLDRATHLEEWIASESPKREIPQDLNLFLSLRSAMKPLTVKRDEIPFYAQAVLAASTILPLEDIEDPQFVLNVDTGDFWVSDAPFMHAVRSHVGYNLCVHVDTPGVLKEIIARLLVTQSKMERNTN
jgi:hypothetical protein